MPYQKFCESERGGGGLFVTAEIRQGNQSDGPISTEEIQYQELW